MFDVDNLSYNCDIRIQPRTWYNLSWTYNAKSLLNSLHLNGKFIKSFIMHKPIRSYEDTPLYVGVGKRYENYAP